MLVMMATVVMTLVKRQMVAANQQVTVANQLVTVAKVQVINGEGADDDWRCCKGVGVVLWWLVASFDLRGLGPYNTFFHTQNLSTHKDSTFLYHC